MALLAEVVVAVARLLLEWLRPVAGPMAAVKAGTSLAAQQLTTLLQLLQTRAAEAVGELGGMHLL